MENEPAEPKEPRKRARVSRRQFVKGATATTSAVIASSYVKPDLRSLGVPGALAQVSDPPPPPPPPPTPPPPGTGTIGFWFASPVSVWPVGSLTIGGVPYTKAQIEAYFPPTGPDMSKMLFIQLAMAMLNVIEGNDSSCIDATIAAANALLATYPPGSGISGPHPAKDDAEDLKDILDDYNNGLLCAPPRD